MNNNHNQQSKLLVSACLLGQPVRYDGKSKPIDAKVGFDWLRQLQMQDRLIVLCPEVAGGLATPRPPAEYQPQTGRVITEQGIDVTEPFTTGANLALNLCQQHNIEFALLKANSPSCGNRQVYDGSFSGRLVKGMGLTAQLLSEQGVTVYSELEMEDLMADFI